MDNITVNNNNNNKNNNNNNKIGGSKYSFRIHDNKCNNTFQTQVVWNDVWLNSMDEICCYERGQCGTYAVNAGVGILLNNTDSFVKS